MVDTDRFVFLVSHERSGSHYLANMLASGSPLVSVDEVCNFNAVDPETAKPSFFRFRRESMVEDSGFALRPDPLTMTRFVDRYLEYLAELVAADSKILLDVKYGHVHNFEVGWWPSERRPFLMKYLEQRNIRVIHLTRRDSVAASVSSYVAEQAGKWHKRTDSAEREMPKLRVPALKIAHASLTLEREKENFFSWLASNRSLAVEYEQLSGSEESRHAVMGQLCAWLGLPQRESFASTYFKVTPPLAEIASNLDEIVRVVRLFGGGRLAR